MLAIREYRRKRFANRLEDANQRARIPFTRISEVVEMTPEAV
jgi:hypothetical protein